MHLRHESMSALMPSSELCMNMRNALQKIPRRIINAPAKLIFPAAPKLLGAQNARAYAVQKIRPYLKKVCSHFCSAGLPAQMQRSTTRPIIHWEIVPTQGACCRTQDQA